MNQNLRDFSDRHFIVQFVSGPYSRIGAHRETLGRFKRYADASSFQKDTIAGLKHTPFRETMGFPPGQYIKLFSVMQPWTDSQWPMYLYRIP